MKETHVIATACGIALIAIIAVFIGYATDTLPKHAPRVITSSLPTSEKSPVPTTDTPRTTRRTTRARPAATTHQKQGGASTRTALLACASQTFSVGLQDTQRNPTKRD